MQCLTDSGNKLKKIYPCFLPSLVHVPTYMVAASDVKLAYHLSARQHNYLGPGFGTYPAFSDDVIPPSWQGMHILLSTSVALQTLKF